MDLLAPCRSCLGCLPFFQVSPPSSPRPSTATTTTSAAPHEEQAEAASSQASASPDPGQRPADLPFQGHDLSSSDKKADELSNFDNVKDSVTAKNEGKPLYSQIIIAPAVASPPPASIICASSHEDAEAIKTATLPELPLHVPFINDISFSASGLMPLQSPMTPAPFGTGYGYPAGQYHPSPHIYPPTNDGSHGNTAPLQEEHGNSLAEHLTSHDGHGPLHHLHNHSHHGHDDSHHGHSGSHHGHGRPPNESLAHSASENISLADAQDMDDTDVPDATHDTSLETFNSTPGFLDTKTKPESKNGDAGAIDVGGDSALIEAYHSEPIIASGVNDGDDNCTSEEGFGHNAEHLGQRRRRRDRFKEQFKGISQQIKQGGHHVKEEGSKHLQTIISNMNKQGQQIEQSGGFFMVTRMNSN